MVSNVFHFILNKLYFCTNDETFFCGFGKPFSPQITLGELTCVNSPLQVLFDRMLVRMG